MKNTFGIGSSEGRMANDTKGIKDVARGNHITIVCLGMHITSQTSSSGIFYWRSDIWVNSHFETFGKDP